MSSIAVISDIHGNLEALKSVLEDIKKRNIEKIICLGDIIAKGSNQKECLELIKENCQIILRGNCDEFFSNAVDINKFNETEQKRLNQLKMDVEIKQLTTATYKIKYFDDIGYVFIGEGYLILSDGMEHQHYFCKIIKNDKKAKKKILKDLNGR